MRMTCCSPPATARRSAFRSMMCGCLPGAARSGCSAYDYRITGRGGQGVNNMELSRRQDAIVAVFPVGHNDQIMLVTDAGMVIRIPVNDIRIARRGSAGVVVFRVDEDERVVSVARLPEVAEENGDGSNGDCSNGHGPDGHGPDSLGPDSLGPDSLGEP